MIYSSTMTSTSLDFISCLLTSAFHTFRAKHCNFEIWYSVGNILEQVAHALPVVCPPHSLCEHHGDIDDLDRDMDIVTMVFIIEIVAANLDLGAFHHILVLRDRVGHHDRLETAVVYPACRVRVKYETILSHLVNQEQLGNISLLPTWRGPPHWRCREWE